MCDASEERGSLPVTGCCGSQGQVAGGARIVPKYSTSSSMMAVDCTVEGKSEIMEKGAVCALVAVRMKNGG